MIASERSTAYGPVAPVEIFQHEWEFEQLLEIYKQQRPATVLEIGTYHGGTLYHWLVNAIPGATVISVDTYTMVDNRHLYPDWVPAGVTLEVITGDSHAQETIDHVAEYAPIDWLFIDGGHWYPEVKADWDNYRPLCNEGAVVAFHDILPKNAQHYDIEVEQLWREIQREGFTTRELVADPNALWGGIGCVLL